MSRRCREREMYGSESEENTFYAANIIANPTLTVAGRTIDTTTIDSDLLQSLHEVDEVEANVSTGYHAIEFLLWGQDLNGTGPGAGQRPATDFMTGTDCTGGNCDRRRAYLVAATDLLIADLEDIVAALLVHDMGDDLADGRPEGEATGREWRTAPLWGTGMTEVVNRHTRFLHDGRARNLAEAILWHGGEAEAARVAFQSMSRVERSALLAFLNSL